MKIARSLLTLATVGALVTGVCGACDKSGGKAEPKFFCKMLGECYRCADAEQQKKCTLNPVTSGCTRASLGECEH